MCIAKASRTGLGRLSDSALNGSKEYNYGVVTAIAGVIRSRRITQIAYIPNASELHQEVREKLDTTSCDHWTAFAADPLSLPTCPTLGKSEGRVEYNHH